MPRANFLASRPPLVPAASPRRPASDVCVSVHDSLDIVMPSAGVVVIPASELFQLPSEATWFPLGAAMLAERPPLTAAASPAATPSGPVPPPSPPETTGGPEIKLTVHTTVGVAALLGG